MSWVLPTELLPVAGLTALVLVWPRLREQPSNRRLFVEALGAALLTIAIFAVAWAFLWSAEQRW